ncbi:hypothetical protein [Bradyrhizobium sp. Arg816]|uniref:hypothetical protein n=1 Tax=Bradyrhizobium sp. Arg816 TaxID=2998491 RepID=UPI00249E5B7D|nr:hypothetical protein [Bradyrhizobium sp. Arg816]MDI3566435.1 hypothetical protein [Bradyrhizobium sp. Arg816]
METIRGQEAVSFPIEAIALCLYFTRDAFAGAFRYYATITHLGALWFIPDLIAFACMATFAYRYAIKQANSLAIFTLLYLVFSLYVGYVFLNDHRGGLSALKMIAPLFVGFCFCGREVKDYRFLLGLIHALFYISIIGLFWSSRVQFPWVGFEYETFGASRIAGKLWWAEGQTRLQGFAADSTMAGYFVLMGYVMTSPRRGLIWCLVWMPIAFYAINNLATSKTAAGTLVLYFLAMMLVRMFQERYRFSVLRTMSLLSFSCIFIPIVLMIVLAGTNLTSLSRSLFSLQDRIDNSWQLPFVYMAKLMPSGFITGCGLGCFNYPQQLFSDKISYWVPVDNFYIGTYLMIGPIFIVFMIFVVLAVARTGDIYKLTLAFVMNIYTITILSYGPASGLLIIGLAFSEVFRRPSRRVTRVMVPTPAGALSVPIRAR